MSRVYSDTTGNSGLLQMYELAIGANLGDVSGNTTKKQIFTSYTRTAFDRFWSLAIPASGTWQLDDSNHTKYNIMKTNIVASQRDYSFTTDEQGNLILDIYKVAIKQSANATDWYEIQPVDTQSETDLATTFNSTTTGVPTSYDKTANGIFFNVLPSYSATTGLLVYFNREASYFTTSDTTKMPGVPGIFHDYFWMVPAQEYLCINGTPARYQMMQQKVLDMEARIVKNFSERPRDEKRQMTPYYENNR